MPPETVATEQEAAATEVAAATSVADDSQNMSTVLKRSKQCIVSNYIEVTESQNCV